MTTGSGQIGHSLTGLGAVSSPALRFAGTSAQARQNSLHKKYFPQIQSVMKRLYKLLVKSVIKEVVVRGRDPGIADAGGWALLSDTYRQEVIVPNNVVAYSSYACRVMD